MSKHCESNRVVQFEKPFCHIHTYVIDVESVIVVTHSSLYSLQKKEVTHYTSNGPLSFWLGSQKSDSKLKCHTKINVIDVYLLIVVVHPSLYTEERGRMSYK